MNLSISIIISLIVSIIPLLSFIKGYKNSKVKLKEYIVSNKVECISLVIVLFACLLRTVCIDKFPAWFNQDEVSSGYEAYSVSNFGIDRNGVSYPVHFISWGNGQNVLYSYILIPFIKILGLTVYSTRLPMAIISCISVLAWYYILKLNIKKIDKKFLTMLSMFSFFPWLIMKSRWGLESNIFLDLILYATFFINKYIDSKKKRYLFFSAFFIGISAYSYGTSYIFLPIYCLGVSAYLLKKKYVKIKEIILPALLVLILVLPMIIFVCINYFDLEAIKIGKITIPKMVISRLHETNLKEGSIIEGIIKNILSNIFILLTRFDGVELNSTIFSVIISVIFSFTFILYFIERKNKENKNILDELMYVWLIAATLTIVFFSYRIIMNNNRINIIIIPYLYFGIKSVININKNTLNKIIYILTVCFVIEYFTIYNIKLENNYNSKEYLEIIEYVQTTENDKNIYIDNNIIKEPYIYYLFYTKMDPNYYFLNCDKKITYRKNFSSESISRIGNVYFYLPDEEDKNNIIITKKEEKEKFSNRNIKEFDNLILVY